MIALRAAWQRWRELDAARTVFARLGAAPELERLETLTRRGGASGPTG